MKVSCIVMILACFDVYRKQKRDTKNNNFQRFLAYRWGKCSPRSIAHQFHRRDTDTTLLLGIREGDALVSGLGNRVDVRACHGQREDGWRSGFVGEDNCFQMASGIASNLQRLF